MKVIYRCEFCRAESENREQIAECESRGIANDLDRPPTGLVGTFCGDPRCTNPFAWMVARNQTTRGHNLALPVWWFRGNGAGDDPAVPGEGRDGVIPELGGDWRSIEPATDCPALRRLAKAARKHGISLYTIVDRVVVPLASVIPDIGEDRE